MEIQRRLKLKFVQMFDRFFYCLNVRCMAEGVQKRKPDLRPYKDPWDSRLSISCFRLLPLPHPLISAHPPPPIVIFFIRRGDEVIPHSITSGTYKLIHAASNIYSKTIMCVWTGLFNGHSRITYSLCQPCIWLVWMQGISSCVYIIHYTVVVRKCVSEVSTWLGGECQQARGFYEGSAKSDTSIKRNSRRHTNDRWEASLILC